MINCVAIYLRKSREDEESKEETLARHEKMLLEYCAKNHLTVEKIYREVVSGENIENRPQMQLLMQDIAEGRYDGVVCVEIERLSRGNVLDQVEILEVFKNSATKIYTLTKIYDLTKEEIDEEYFEFALFMSRREYKTIKRRLLRGRTQATKEGYYTGSRLPYGFDKEKQDKGFVLIPNKKEAEVVRLIFDKYIDGMGAHRIAQDLNKSGLKTKNGRSWSSVRVMDMLKNKQYIGYVRLKDEWFKGKHEPIIDKEIFDQVQEIHTMKFPKVRKNAILRNPLAGICRCGCCGLLMQRCCKHTKSSTIEYLLCNSNYSCTNRKAVRISDIEDAILDALKDELKDFNYFLDNYTQESTKEEEKIKNELSLLNAELTSKQNQIESACDMLEQGVYTIELFKKRTKTLESAIESIKEQIEQLKVVKPKNNKKIPILEKVIDEYDNLTIEEKNRLLRALVDVVEINTENDETTVNIRLKV